MKSLFLTALVLLTAVSIESCSSPKPHRLPRPVRQVVTAPLPPAPPAPKLAAAPLAVLPPKTTNWTVTFYAQNGAAGHCMTNLVFTLVGYTNRVPFTNTVNASPNWLTLSYANGTNPLLLSASVTLSNQPTAVAWVAGKSYQADGSVWDMGTVSTGKLQTNYVQVVCRGTNFMWVSTNRLGPWSFVNTNRLMQTNPADAQQFFKGYGMTITNWRQ